MLLSLDARTLAPQIACRILMLVLLVRRLCLPLSRSVRHASSSPSESKPRQRLPSWCVKKRAQIVSSWAQKVTDQDDAVAVALQPLRDAVKQQGTLLI